MKFRKLVPLLAACLFLFACGNGAKDTADAEAQREEALAAERDAAGEKNTTNGEEDKDTADENADYDPEGDREKKEKELFESEDEKTRYAALEDASDYIALVELSTAANGEVGLEFVKNYKGALSTVELPAPKGLTPNREYIIFYRDEADGTVAPTHATNGFYRVDGSDDALLRYMEKKYAEVDDRLSDDEKTDKKDTKTDTKPSATTTNDTKKTTTTNDTKKTSNDTDNKKTAATKDSTATKTRTKANSTKTDAKTGDGQTKKKQTDLSKE